VTGEWLPPKPPGGEAPERPAPPPASPPPTYEPAPAQRVPPGYRAPSAPPPSEPPNNDAVAGFTCAIIGSSLLLLTGGLSSIVSLVLGIVAIPYARRGQRNVDEGKTGKQRSMASAGYVIGIVTVVLSVVAIITWILIFATVDIDWDEFDDPNGDPFDQDEFSLR